MYNLSRNLRFILILLLISPAAIAANTSVKGHIRKNGHYVYAHNRSNKNKTKIDNYSSKGNSNPFTGKKGTKK